MHCQITSMKRLHFFQKQFCFCFLHINILNINVNQTISLQPLPLEPEKGTLRKKCPYLEFFWPIFSPNEGKHGPEKPRIRTLFTQWKGCYKIIFSGVRDNVRYIFLRAKIPHV